MSNDWTCSTICVLALLGVVSSVSGQNTNMTYQGLLKDAGVAVDSSADFRFSLHDADTGGSPVGPSLTTDDVAIVDGLFTVELDFGAASFNGGSRWLEIEVRSPHDPTDTQPFATLTPRQPLTAAPFAMYAFDGPGAAGSVWGQSGSSVYYNAGSVGVGTSTPLSPLHVEGVARATAFSVHNPNNAGASVNLSWLDDVPRLRYGGSGPGNQNGFAIHGTGDAVKLRLLDNGALGLSTNNPGGVISNSKLDVIGGHIAVSNNFGLFSFNNTTNGVGAGIDTTTGDDLHLYAAGVARASVTAVGNVGVGTTSPNAKLDVRGRLVLDDGAGGLIYTAASGGEQSRYLRLINSPDTASASGLMAGGVLVSDNYGYATPGKNDLIVKGEVGVGTASPAATLHVVSDTFPNVQITQTDNTDYARLMLDGNGSIYQLNAGSPGANLPDTFNIFRPGTGNVLTIQPDGDIGIGTSLPDAKLHVRSNSFATAQITQTNNSDYARLILDGNGSMYQLNVGSPGATLADSFNIYRAGVGNVLTIRSTGNVGIGTSIPSSKLHVNGRTTTDELEITGGSDLSEKFDIDGAGAKVEPGMVVCIDPSNPGKLAVSNRPYDVTVAGIISGAGGVKPGMTMGQRGSEADGEHPVALTGRVYVKVTAKNGAIRPGDMLTTSTTAGYAMKATDRERAFGATIGKAMTLLDRGEGLVLVLVNLQ